MSQQSLGRDLGESEAPPAAEVLPDISGEESPAEHAPAEAEPAEPAQAQSAG
jgi:hypothetical protein